MQSSTLNITATDGPAALASTALTEIKQHLRVTHSYEDDLIQTYFDAAVHMVETYASITLGRTTWELRLPGFPQERYIELPRGPVESVTSLKYYDTSDVDTTWAASDYIVSLSEMPARIYLEESDVWEETRQRPDAVRVTYISGASSWSTLPTKVKPALMMLTAHQYTFRQPVLSGTTATELPWALRSNLQSIREDFQT